MENNNQDIKLCPVCGAKNKSAYKYCNECGAALNQTDYRTANGSDAPPIYNNIPPNQPPYGGYPGDANAPYYNGQFGQGGYTPYPPYGMNMNAPFFGTPDFGGVSAKDVYEYTGCKPELFNKLRIQHFSGRTPYCWPLFVLGFLLRFFGMGCWYLYHKMYKPALAFFAGAVADLAIKFYVIFIAFEEFLGSIDADTLKKFANGETVNLDEMIITSANPSLRILDSISGLIGLAAFVLAIVMPFFAYKQYKNQALLKIRAEYTKSPMPEITMAGGTKGGLVAIISVIYAVVSIFVCALLVGWVADSVIDKLEQSPDFSYGDSFEQLPFDNEPGDIW